MKRPGPPGESKHNALQGGKEISYNGKRRLRWTETTGDKHTNNQLEKRETGVRGKKKEGGHITLSKSNSRKKRKLPITRTSKVIFFCHGQ